MILIDRIIHSEAQTQTASNESAQTEPEIEVLGVVHDQETGANIGGMKVNGQEVVVIDVNNDEVFDVMASDINHNNKIDENEMVDISQQGLTVDEFNQHVTNEQYMMAEAEPDYVNNADTGVYEA